MITTVVRFLAFAFLSLLLTACSKNGSASPADDPENGAVGNTETEEDTGAHAQSGNLPAWRAGYLDIHFINTGTGECSFIIMPDGTQMLVDAASSYCTPEDENDYYVGHYPNSSRRPSEWINLYLEKCKSWTGNDVIDYLNVTHFHSDHIGQRFTGCPDGEIGQGNPLYTADGRKALRDITTMKEFLEIGGGYMKIGVAEILDENKVGVVTDKAYPDYDYPKPLACDVNENGKSGYHGWTVLNYRNAAQYHKKNSGLVREAFRPGAKDQFVMKYRPEDYPDFEIRNLSANGLMWTGSGAETLMTFPENDQLSIDSNEGKDSPNENMTSTVFMLRYGNFDYFCGGDVVSNSVSSSYPWRDAEKHLANVTGEVDLLKANHHGSADGNSEYFLSILNPQVIVVNVWRRIQPRKDTYERMISSKCNHGMTDIFTTNKIASYHNEYSDKGARIKGKQGHFVVRVNPGGEKFYIYQLNDSDAAMSMKIIKRFGPYTSRK